MAAKKKVTKKTTRKTIKKTAPNLPPILVSDFVERGSTEEPEPIRGNLYAMICKYGIEDLKVSIYSSEAPRLPELKYCDFSGEMVWTISDAEIHTTCTDLLESLGLSESVLGNGYLTFQLTPVRTLTD